MILFRQFKGRRLIAGLAIGLFILYLIFANRLFVKFATSDQEFVVRATRPISIQTAARFCIDGIQTSPSTLLETVEVIGWALPPDNPVASSEGRFDVSLVFQTGKTWYRVGTTSVPRLDVLSQFKIDNPHCLPGWVSVFSPVRMKGGIYRMGVWVQDRGQDVAFAWTGKRFVNGRHGFRELVFRAELLPIARPEPKGDMQAHAFDVFTSTTATVWLEGWAFANTGGASEDQEVHLVLSSEECTFALATEKKDRPDLRAVFGEGMRVEGEVSGYSSSLSLSELPFGTYRLGMLIRERHRDVAFSWLGNCLLHTPSGGLVNRAAPPPVPPEPERP